MGWWPFGRGQDGRHALGAAVTSLPTGPLIVPVPSLAAWGHPAGPSTPPAAEPAVPAALVEPAAGPVDVPDPVGAPQAPGAPEATAPEATAPEPDAPVGSLVDELSRLLAAADPAALDLDALLALVQVPVQPVAEPPAADVHVPAPRSAEPAAPAPDLPAVEPAVDLGVGSQPQPGVEPFLVVPLPAPPPFVPGGPLPVVAVPQQQGRVELGFRDGSTAALQPDSPSALALAELARLLTAPD